MFYGDKLAFVHKQLRIHPDHGCWWRTFVRQLIRAASPSTSRSMAFSRRATDRNRPSIAFWHSRLEKESIRASRAHLTMAEESASTASAPSRPNAARACGISSRHKRTAASVDFKLTCGAFTPESASSISAAIRAAAPGSLLDQSQMRIPARRARLASALSLLSGVKPTFASLVCHSDRARRARRSAPVLRANRRGATHIH